MSKPKSVGARKVTEHKAGTTRGMHRPNVRHNTYALVVNGNESDPDYKFHTYKTRKIAKAVARMLVASEKAVRVEVVNNNSDSRAGRVSVFNTSNVKVWPKYRPGKVRSVTQPVR